jgi:hypothetical protein
VEEKKVTNSKVNVPPPLEIAPSHQVNDRRKPRLGEYHEGSGAAAARIIVEGGIIARSFN